MLRPPLLLAPLLLACLMPRCAEPEPRATVTVATWNVHRLFDGVCDSGGCGGSSYEAAPTTLVLEGQLDRIADAVGALEADVILLQEVETAALLDAIADRLDGSHPYAVFGEGGAAGSLGVGVLSRLPVEGVTRHGETPLYRPDGTGTTFAREVLELKMRTTVGPVVVFAAHLKSKRDDDPGRRWAEAEHLGALAREAARSIPEALIIVGGDLNDVPGSPPLRALEEGGRLCRVADPLGDGAATHRYAGTDEAIDHLLRVRADAAEPCGGRAWVVGTPGGGLAGSDHAALVAAFTLPTRPAGHDGADPTPDPG